MVTSVETPRPGHGRIAGLDLVRGLAIALVLVRHAWPEVIGSGGIVGVVAFFALSGYLITGLLTNDIRRYGRVRYGRFYRNRAIRLFPPLLAMLAGVVVAMTFWDPLGDKAGLWRAVLTAVTYTGNLPYDHGTAAVGHLWTLATEEQFYIVWPILLTFAIRWKKIGLVVAGSAVAIVIALLATIWVSIPEVGRIYPLPSSWAIAMVIGAAAKLWEPELRALFPASAASRASLGWVAAAALVAISFVPEDKAAPWSYFVLGPSVAVVAVVLIYSWSEWRSLPSRHLRPLLALGTVSYAAYLWNYPIVTWMGERPLPWFSAIGSIILTIAAATLSWWVIELPSQRWRARLDRNAAARRMKASSEAPDMAPSTPSVAAEESRS